MDFLFAMFWLVVFAALAAFLVEFFATHNSLQTMKYRAAQGGEAALAISVLLVVLLGAVTIFGTALHNHDQCVERGIGCPQELPND